MSIPLPSVPSGYFQVPVTDSPVGSAVTYTGGRSWRWSVSMFTWGSLISAGPTSPTSTTIPRKTRPTTAILFFLYCRQ